MSNQALLTVSYWFNNHAVRSLTLTAFAERVIQRILAYFLPKPVSQAWLRQKHRTRWKVVNAISKRKFNAKVPVLSVAQLLVLSALSVSGIAVTDFDTLDVLPGLWESLSQFVNEFASASATYVKAFGGSHTPAASHLGAFVSGTIMSLGHNVERNQRLLTQQDNAVSDDYLVKLYPPSPTLELDNPLLRFGLHPTVLNIVNSYFGLWSKLIYTDVWCQLKFDQKRRIGSQRWHRDPEDQQIVKLYLYFSDVDDGNGAMEYISRSSNRLAEGCEDIARWRAAGGTHYPPSEDLERRIPRLRWVTTAGKRGTLVFCDTTGFHRGNIANKSSRIAATWTFVTPASLFPRRFTVGSKLSCASLSDAARFAIS